MIADISRLEPELRLTGFVLSKIFPVFINDSTNSDRLPLYLNLRPSPGLLLPLKQKPASLQLLHQAHL